MMNSEEVKQPKYKNIFIVPVFGIAFFVILTMTFSYAYYTRTATQNTAYDNVTLPNKCALTVKNATTTLTVNRAFLVQDSTITSPVKVNTSAYVNLTGTNSCSCSYTVRLFRDSGNAYSPSASGANEFRYSVKTVLSDSNTPNTSSSSTAVAAYFPNCSNGTIDSSTGCVVSTGTIGVVTSGTKVYHRIYFELDFYRLDSINQLSQQGKSAVYSLRVTTSSCT